MGNGHALACFCLPTTKNKMLVPSPGQMPVCPCLLKSQIYRACHAQWALPIGHLCKILPMPGIFKWENVRYGCSHTPKFTKGKMPIWPCLLPNTNRSREPSLHWYSPRYFHFMIIMCKVFNYVIAFFIVDIKQYKLRLFSSLKSIVSTLNEPKKFFLSVSEKVWYG